MLLDELSVYIFPPVASKDYLVDMRAIWIRRFVRPHYGQDPTLERPTGSHKL